jgi:chaperone LolA
VSKPKVTKYVISFIILLLLWARPGSCNDPQLILTGLQERYDKLSDLAVDFVQEVHSGVFAAVERTSGKMFLASGDKFRVQTDEQTIVSDGNILWVYSRENKQVTIDKVAKSRDIVRPSDYLFTFRESYTSYLLPDTTIGRVECMTILLVCDEKDEFIQQMTLYVGKEDLLTHRASYVDINGNNVIIDFSNLKVDKGLPDDVFFFETPKGVEEVRLP